MSDTGAKREHVFATNRFRMLQQPGRESLRGFPTPVVINVHPGVHLAENATLDLGIAQVENFEAILAQLFRFPAKGHGRIT